MKKCFFHSAYLFASNFVPPLRSKTTGSQSISAALLFFKKHSSRECKLKLINKNIFCSDFLNKRIILNALERKYFTFEKAFKRNRVSFYLR